MDQTSLTVNQTSLEWGGLMFTVVWDIILFLNHLVFFQQQQQKIEYIMSYLYVANSDAVNMLNTNFQH